MPHASAQSSWQEHRRVPTVSTPIRHIIALSQSTAPKVQSATLAVLKSIYMYRDKCGSKLRAKAKFTLTCMPVKFAKDLLICIRTLHKICIQNRKINNWPCCPRFVRSCPVWKLCHKTTNVNASPTCVHSEELHLSEKGTHYFKLAFWQ
jgi:hypothetical protein